MTLKTILHELEAFDRSPAILRKFGFFSTGVFLILTALVTGRIWGQPITWTAWVFLSAGVSMFLIAVFFPSKLRSLHTIMFVISYCIGLVMNTVILFMVFFGLFAPIGGVMRLIGRDILGLKHNPDCASFWRERTSVSDPKERYPRLF